ncbi:PEP-CTERM sorting domain-containing protein [Akkermansiaceae bacterium]|nr:PEP-CTERM sorting domain-containing protein [Akkermansiaceae bacterium]
MKSKATLLAFAVSVAALPAAVLVTPTNLTNTSGVSEFFAANNIINDTGLSGAATLANYTTITHAAAGVGNAWTTNNPNGAGDYFLGASPGILPVFTLDLGGSYELTDFVFWGYHFNANNANEGRQFSLEFSNNGGGSYGAPVIIENPLSTYAFSSASTLSLGGTFTADTVRVSIPDNHFGGVAPGGDRVGLGEVKFIGDAIPEPSTSLLGGLALLGLLRRRR